MKLSISKDVAIGIFFALTGEERQLVHFGDFVQNASAILKGSHSQKSNFLCKVCSQNTTKLDLQQLRVLLLWFLRVLLTSECAENVFPQSSSFRKSAESSQHMISYLLSTMVEGDSGEVETVSIDSLENWMAATPLAVQIFETIFAFIFYYRVVIKGTSMPGDLMAYFGIELDPETGKVIPDRLILPLRIQHPFIRESFDSELLDQSSLMLLNSYFPHSLRGRFYPLFSSTKHGQSFSTFCKLLLGCAGPTLLVVKDKNGYIFGGFASTKWQIDPNFTG